jgi:hypothetical protein
MKSLIKDYLPETSNIMLYHRNINILFQSKLKSTSKKPSKNEKNKKTKNHRNDYKDI